jgi:hypothetical protein
LITTPPLSAPEAYLLRSLPRYDPRYALKIGFMGLMAQGVLRLETEDRRGLLRTRHIPHLRVVDNGPTDLPPIAAALVKVVHAAAPAGLVSNVLNRARAEYGTGLRRFVRDWVAPALVARGLAGPYRRRLLGLVPYDTFARTPEGDAEKARLDRLIEDARRIPQYLDRAPDRVPELIAALGTALVLVDELRPHYQALSRAMRERGTGDSMPFDGISGAPGDVPTGLFDLGNIDFGSFDTGALASLDAGFSGDGGGGDGGGGDGGGGSSC